jgi:DNA-binding CsgD family transcriptional regulator
MTKLSDTQLRILVAATQHPDRLALPLPATLKGGAAAKVVGSLLKAGLIAHSVARAGDCVWETHDDGTKVTLSATDAAFEALGIAIEDAPTGAVPPKEKAKRVKAAKTETAPRAPRAGTKQAQLIALLERARGASIAEIAEALGWQAHTIRAALSHALGRKLALKIVSHVDAKRGRVYRIEA